MLRFNGGQWTHRCRDQNMKTGQEATARPKKLKGRCVRPRCPEGEQNTECNCFSHPGRGSRHPWCPRAPTRAMSWSKQELKRVFLSVLCGSPSFCIGVLLGCHILLEVDRNSDGGGIGKTWSAVPQSYTAKSKPAGLKLNHSGPASTLDIHISLLDSWPDNPSVRAFQESQLQIWEPTNAIHLLTKTKPPSPLSRW